MKDLPPVKFKEMKAKRQKVKSRSEAERVRKANRAARQVRKEARLQMRADKREEEKQRRAEMGEPEVTKAKKCAKKNNHGTEVIDATILKVLGKSQKSKKVVPKRKKKNDERPEVAGPRPKWRHGMREERQEGRTIDSSYWRARKQKPTPA